MAVFKNNYKNITDDQFDAIVMCMDDDIRELVHAKLAPCTSGEFLTAYLEIDRDFAIEDFKTNN